ncbi:LysE family translocator [Knoellia koreensis]|uniref:LysE family translocator n=1 Tax=Knoellia koreensis TaxID=2730921 RepID=A0A849HL50_9MICO|nr:LysE family translocator [Knoellia sp. DB2414S]NNM47403.1 LysE family translocator [Knoellia sp. DB2414S]
MPSAATLGTFALAATALILLPGPAMLFLISRGIGQSNPRLAVASMLGIESATACMVVATAFGLSAVISSSVVAFAVVKYAGAAYLLWLAVREFRSKGHFSLDRAPVVSSRRAFVDAFAVGISNPKTAVFFVAFFPQFLHRDAGAVWSQVLVLGAIFVVIGAVFDSFYALSAGGVGRWLQRHPKAVERQKYVSGSIFLVMGGAAALTGHPQKA